MTVTIASLLFMGAVITFVGLFIHWLEKGGY